MIKPKDFIKIKHDVNGNPRYVVYFLNFLSIAELNLSASASELYKIALKRARKLGCKKYHNKSYDGGIVFQAYNLDSEVCMPINKDLAP